MKQRTFLLRDASAVLALRSMIRDWPHHAALERPLAVTVAEHKARRNGAQNRRYWALLNLISENAWVDKKKFSSDAWHAEFATRLIGWSETPSGGRIPISTTTLSTGEFAEYMDKIEHIAVTELELDLMDL